MRLDSASPDQSNRAIVVMGAAGAGKTTVATELAERLGRDFIDADVHHTQQSRKLMADGVGLDENTRRAWLDAVGVAVNDVVNSGREVVVACSALRSDHRDRLRMRIHGAKFFWLDVPATELQRRLDEREGHFAGSELLASQLETLEPPAPHEATRIDASEPINTVVSTILDAL